MLFEASRDAAEIIDFVEEELNGIAHVQGFFESGRELAATPSWLDKLPSS